MVYKAVALARLVRPDANIPATTALATINKKNGRELGLQRGANVFMPNLTPLKYRRLYEIYPNKACIAETGDACNGCLSMRIHSIDRHIGCGHGGRRNRDWQVAQRGSVSRSNFQLHTSTVIPNALELAPLLRVTDPRSDGEAV
jgi:biotin synthase